MLKTTLSTVMSFALILSFCSCEYLTGQVYVNGIKAAVDFKEKLRTWDGFGVNYVETSQTFNYNKYAQDYGGFSLLEEDEKQEILELIFSEDGLKVNLVKMFLDPHHQQKSGGSYDHETTTRNMRYFVKEGIDISAKRGQELSIITTLYSPPGYMTLQETIRGRDLDPEHEEDLVKYLINWSRYLVENDYPLRYISLHNEGESWLRWPDDGTAANTVSEGGHDYNLFWSPEMVNRFILDLSSALQDNGLQHLGITNGETTNWYRFGYWGYADAIADSNPVLNKLSLVTSHGFYVGGQDKGRWFGPHSSYGIDMIRKKRPDIHAWATSSSWDEKVPVCDGGVLDKDFVMDAGFIKQIHGNIYEAKINGFIPWALIQRASHWNKPDPNPGSAFRVYEDGSWEIKKGYYYYKQVSRAGQPGTSVVHTSSMDSEVAIIGFAGDDSLQNNAFVLINYGMNDKKMKIRIKGSSSDSYEAFRTSGKETFQEYSSARDELNGENYSPLGNFVLDNTGSIVYMAPANSVTTFFEEPKLFK